MWEITEGTKLVQGRETIGFRLACLSAQLVMFRDAWPVIKERVIRSRIERWLAKEIPAIAACICCLMAHTAGIPHEVG
jgi:hypothetical protein